MIAASCYSWVGVAPCNGLEEPESKACDVSGMLLDLGPLMAFKRFYE